METDRLACMNSLAARVDSPINNLKMKAGRKTSMIHLSTFDEEGASRKAWTSQKTAT